LIDQQFTAWQVDRLPLSFGVSATEELFRVRADGSCANRSPATARAEPMGEASGLAQRAFFAKASVHRSSGAGPRVLSRLSGAGADVQSQRSNEVLNLPGAECILVAARRLHLQIGCIQPAS
jgi:hypothetical protein